MNDVRLDEVQSHKHLGITISKTLEWSEHIENIVAKANQCLNVLSGLKYKLDRKTLETLYFAFIRSKLEYACIVWDNCTKEQKDLVESVQYRAAKIVSGGIHRTSHDVLYNELGWETLEARRKKQRLSTFYKMTTNDAPSYLQGILPTRSAHNLRNPSNFTIPKCRTVQFLDSFLPQTVRDWNQLSDATKHSTSLESFKTKLNSNLQNVPSWYYKGDRKYSIMHARLRMSCSPLNSHLYNLAHIVQNPACACGFTKETSKHFIFECPLYYNERNILLQSLRDLNFTITEKNMLFGSKDYTEEKNCKAFLAFQQYLKETQRFD